MMVISSQSHTQHVHKSMDILGEDKVNVKFFIFLENGISCQPLLSFQFIGICPSSVSLLSLSILPNVLCICKDRSKLIS